MKISAADLKQMTIQAGGGQSETLKQLLIALAKDGEVIVVDHANTKGVATFAGAQS